ncbi:MAG: hypothetical protein SGPRY_003663 [Prymnesium sp.]
MSAPSGRVWSGVCRLCDGCVLHANHEGECKLGSVETEEYEMERIIAEDWKDAAAKTGPPKKASRAARAAPRKRGSGVSRGEEEDQGDTADEPSNATSTSAPSSSEAGQTSARRREEREDQVAIVEDVPNAFSAAARKSSSMAILKRISRPAKRSCGRQSPTKSRDKKRKQVAQPAHLDLLLARFCQRVVKACSCGAAGDMGS